MNAQEAERLMKKGIVVIWDGDNNDRGTVRCLNNVSGFYVEWENGQCGWIDYRDAGKISCREP